MLVSLLVLLCFLLPFSFRTFDDNRLTSWEWVFDGANVVRMVFLLLGGISLAYLLSRSPLPERAPSLFLFMAAFGSASLFRGEPEAIVDASRYFTQAKYLSVYGVGSFLSEWGKALPAWTDMPLIPFLYGLIFSLFGEERGVLQIFTTTLFSLTVVLIYRTGKELWDEEVGVYAGTSFLGIPYLFTQVPLMMVDVPSTFFLLLSVFTLLKGIRCGGKWVPLAAFAALFAFLSKYSLWMMLSVLGIAGAVLVQQGRATGEGKERLHRLLSVFLLFALLAGGSVLLKSGVVADQLRLLSLYQKPGLKRWGESYLSTFFFQIHPFVTLAAAGSVFAALRKKDLTYLIVVWLIALLFLLQIKRIRYSLPAFPMFALMASYGLREIRDKGLRKFTALCIMICSLVIALFAYRPFMQSISSVNLKNAGEFLDTIQGKECEVFVLPYGDPVLNPAVSVPLLDLYTRKEIRFEPLPGPQPPPEIRTVSPLRFTWEYRNPPYYSRPRPRGHTPKGADHPVPVAVISEHPVKELPAFIRERVKGLSAVRSFTVSDDIFLHQTVVTVYYRQGTGNQ
ncbi:MAG: glycosyltransferase family 39 protein [Alphaproteobacteria bacterium]|uniref:Glycosyltransferase family 39 protein n=1 Tax=Candidatus Nitrobium versatile TaxID=2884831 RepID=A0A953M2Y1_9BACT|nr:glycosyltransferase family 39 protein [Candidatus Nitrobium versatile]